MRPQTSVGDHALQTLENATSCEKTGGRTAKEDVIRTEIMREGVERIEIVIIGTGREIDSGTEMSRAGLQGRIARLGANSSLRSGVRADLPSGTQTTIDQRPMISPDPALN